MIVKSFLQTDDWSEFQELLGREVFEYDKDGIRANIIKHKIPFHKNYLYIPHGPEINFNSMTGGISNPVKNFIKYLKDLGRREKSIFIKAEPLVDSIAQVLAENGFKKSKKEIQPSKTVIIDLLKSEDELFSQMRHKTKYNIKIAEKHGIHVDEKNDRNLFWKLLKRTSKRDRFSPHPEDYYKKLLLFPWGNEISVKLFTAFHGQTPISSAVILIYGDTTYYLHGASDYDYRKYMAPYILHWKIIQYLKSKEIKFYDLWGIDARKWPGVTRFKLGWGGRTVEYSGAFDLTISWHWHMAYKIFQKIKRGS